MFVIKNLNNLLTHNSNNLTFCSTTATVPLSNSVRFLSPFICLINSFMFSHLDYFFIIAAGFGHVHLCYYCQNWFCVYSEQQSFHCVGHNKLLNFKFFYHINYSILYNSYSNNRPYTCNSIHQAKNFSSLYFTSLIPTTQKFQPINLGSLIWLTSGSLNSIQRCGDYIFFSDGHVLSSPLT